MTQGHIDHTLDRFQFREDNLCLSDPDIITSFSCYVIPAGWHEDSLNKDYAPACAKKNYSDSIETNIAYNPPHPPTPTLSIHFQTENWARWIKNELELVDLSFHSFHVP